MKYDFAAIEKKWQEKWEQEKPYAAVTGDKKPKFYGLIEFPYPSAAGLHVGHPRPFTAMDIICRKKRMQGYNVLNPIGFDAFGLPTENFAIKNHIHPAIVTKKNIENFTRQLKMLGYGFDWDRVIDTTDPNYYRWTQWIFLQMYKHGLAYKTTMPVNWCTSCKCVLANEEVVEGVCERCGAPVVRKEKSQWMLRITKYADRLADDLDLEGLDYIERVKTQQKNWIGRSTGTEVTFKTNTEDDITVYTTRVDTLFGVTYTVISPEHPLLNKWKDRIANWADVEAYKQAAARKSDFERGELNKDKTGVRLEGIEAILKEAEATDLKIYFVVPSHVPFSPNLETSGGRFNPEIIRKALKRPDAVGLSECVGPYITAGFPDLLESFDTTLSMPGKTLQGHLPDMYGPAMSACIAAGVSTDHESFCEKDVFERLRNGCHLMMREGSAARNMPVLLKTVMENHLDTAMVSIVTDDLHTVDLQERGHLDDSLRTALGMGLDFVKAIQMVTVNCARAFNLDREIGGLAPGRRADVNITTGPEDFRVLTTFAGGRQITDNGKLLVHYETAAHEPCVLNTMHLKNPITADSFKIHAPAGAKKVKALVMDTLPYMPFTNRRDVELPVVDGVVQCDVEQDVLYIAQVERHGKNGNVGKAFMGGFHIRGGAMASSVGHDNHNIIVMGDSFEDMALADYDRDWLVRYTYNSNAIEGSTLTLEDTSLVLEGEFVPSDSPARYVFAARGVADGMAYVREYAREGRRLDEELVRRVHEVTALDLQPFARGTFRPYGYLARITATRVKTAGP